MSDEPSVSRALAAVGALVIAALLIAVTLLGYSTGYKIGLKSAPVLYAQDLGPIRYVDVPGPERIVKEPYEQLVEVPVLTPVPGPTVYVPVPGPTIVKKIFVRAPPTSDTPSIADALNNYEWRNQAQRAR